MDVMAATLFICPGQLVAEAADSKLFLLLVRRFVGRGTDALSLPPEGSCREPQASHHTLVSKESRAKQGEIMCQGLWFLL
mmetsp:Transcript_35963/g.101848  ORF Transcript_35963/g.101848 Transcript_35963/m.101848 type:complete len:80 (+) Transcript_35963:246-485(+)